MTYTKKKQSEQTPPYVLHNDKKKLVCKINRQTRQGECFIVPDSGSRQFVSRLRLSGFSSLPSGLRRSGFGLTTVGYRILKALFETLGEFELTIDKSAKSTVGKVGDSYRVILNHHDLTVMLDSLRRIGGEKFREQNLAIEQALYGHFPGNCPKPKEETSYRAGNLAAMLSDKAMLKKLSPKDIDTMGAFLPGFLKHYGATVSAPKKLLALSKTRNAAEIVYLDKIIKQFEKG
jgi:hypothetical protein